MKKVKVHLNERSYDIIIQHGSISRAAVYLEAVPKIHKKAAVISNNKIFSLYGKRLCKNLKNAGYDIHTILVPHGEKSKTLSEAEKIYHQLLKHKFNRETTLFALGGGVIGDLTGFVAATFIASFVTLFMSSSSIILCNNSISD